MALSQEGDIEGPPAGSCVVIAKLIAEDCLAGSRQALKDADTPLRESTLQNSVKARDSTSHPFERALGHRSAPSGPCEHAGRQTAKDDPLPGALSMWIAPLMVVTS